MKRGLTVPLIVLLLGVLLVGIFSIGNDLIIGSESANLAPRTESVEQPTKFSTKSSIVTNDFNGDKIVDIKDLIYALYGLNEGRISKEEMPKILELARTLQNSAEYGRVNLNADATQEGEIVYLQGGPSSIPEVCQLVFIRGDADLSGSYNIVDAIDILEILFIPPFASYAAGCRDAGDSNDDGTVNIADVVHLLTYMFAGGPSPPAPNVQTGPGYDEQAFPNWALCDNVNNDNDTITDEGEGCSSLLYCSGLPVQTWTFEYDPPGTAQGYLYHGFQDYQSCNYVISGQQAPAQGTGALKVLSIDGQIIQEKPIIDTQFYLVGSSLIRSQDGNYVIAGNGVGFTFMTIVDANYIGASGTNATNNTLDYEFMVFDPGFIHVVTPNGFSQSNFGPYLFLPITSNGFDQFSYYALLGPDLSLITSSNPSPAFNLTYLSSSKTSDGGFILGKGYFTNGEVSLAKYDSNFQLEWEVPYQTFGFEQTIESIIQTSDEGYVFVGRKGAEQDAYITKTDSNGSILWEETVGNATSDDRFADVILTYDGGYVAVGSTNPLNMGSLADILLAKFNSNGQVGWVRVHGDSEQENAYSVEQVGDLGYLVVGSKDFLDKGFVLKTDSLGNI